MILGILLSNFVNIGAILIQTKSNVQMINGGLFFSFLLGGSVAYFIKGTSMYAIKSLSDNIVF